LQSVLQDPDHARQMGEAGARHVREHFTSAQAAAQLRELARLVART
jgi:glycosyltransferase involved in cell wall biosynthesis